ncbi:DUF3570 domain-containing protein [Colwellia sp. E2M01]|uniref:DUF3570 domain-containing protein n=1 Tax=Colwellia sp. E2M01 TaxID=2841561 RepID=UPI001C08FCD9|nr:DUF3570 domain-containing protein [Colwellia sp. E2M01]MBU2870669.1 DUF3570 domain-containing protein [Colwellia sp. E2M01]
MSTHQLLKSLSAAALALPAIASQASTIADNAQFGYRYNTYQEQDLAAADVHSGSLERYIVDVNQFSLLTPLNEYLQASISLQFESMSGASPWYTQTVEGEMGDEIKQVMSGASIEEDRTDIITQLTYFGDSYSVSGTVAKSTENDYNSLSGGVELSYDFSDKLTTLGVSADYSTDEITPSDALEYNRTPYEEKQSWSGHISLSRVVTKNLIVQLGYGLFNRSGYLSDPYKRVIVDSKLIDDSRPDSRLASTYTGRLRYFVEGIDTALHFDYRLYEDNWDVLSHTIEFAPYINIGADWQIVPSIRYYSQKGAFFYENYYEYVREDGYYSTDSRLSSYGAYTIGAKVNKKIGDWFLTASYQYYTSSHDLGIDDYNETSNSLVDFDIVSIGFDYIF